MKKNPVSLYLDTNIWSSPFDGSIFSQESVTFFERMKQETDCWHVFISELVLSEVGNTKGDKLNNIKKLIESVYFKELPSNESVIEIAQEYIKRKILKTKHFRDAMHIAFATYYSIDYLVSLNFDDINNISTINAIEIANLSMGFKHPLKICTPMEIR